jgi:hypothetical protein
MAGSQPKEASQMVKRYTLGRSPAYGLEHNVREFDMVESAHGEFVGMHDYRLLAERCERLEGDALDALNFAFEKEIQRVSHIEYDSNEICRHFFKELRRSFIEALSGSSGGKDG